MIVTEFLIRHGHISVERSRPPLASTYKIGYIESMDLNKEIQARLDEFAAICKKHKVEQLFVFGSAVKGPIDEKNSDIDFLVQIDQKDPIERGECLMNLWNELESFFHCEVDLLTKSSIENPVLKQNIDQTKVLLYDGRRQKVLV